MNDLVEDILPLVDREIVRNSIVVTLDLERQPLAWSGDRVQLQQVVINLVMNAVQAMAGVADQERRLSIGTRNSVAGDKAVVLQVTDSGVGIDAKTASELFKPFFTTKNDGMGMGLSICRSIVEAHGGTISAAPSQPRGASFEIRLPIQHEGQT